MGDIFNLEDVGAGLSEIRNHLFSDSPAFILWEMSAKRGGIYPLISCLALASADSRNPVKRGNIDKITAIAMVIADLIGNGFSIFSQSFSKIVCFTAKSYHPQTSESALIFP